MKNFLIIVLLALFTTWFAVGDAEAAPIRQIHSAVVGDTDQVIPAQFQASFSPLRIPEAPIRDQGDAANVAQQALCF